MTLHGLSADATHRDLDLTIDDLLRHGRTSTRWLVKLDCYLRAARRFGEATPGGVFGGNLEARKDCEAAIRELRRWILTRVRAGVIREAVMLAPFLTLASASEANRRLARSVKRAAAAVPWSRDSSAGSRRRRYKRLLQAFALLPTQRNARALLATSRRV
jgi:hypothetical protein